MKAPRTITLGILVAVLAGRDGRAQAPTPAPASTAAFEVASIKRSQATPALRAVRLNPGGRVAAVGVTLEDLIRTAYTHDGIVVSSQIKGGPGWIRSDRFDLQAKMPEGSWADGAEASRHEAAMLKTLLTDRFGLKLQFEQQKVPVFDLVVVKQDGSTGSDLKKSSCVPGALPAAPANATGAQPCDSALRFMAGGIGSNGITMDTLAATLAPFPAVERPIRNRTGLAGFYDLHLKFVGIVTPNGRSNPDADAGPNLFTAMEEQLGLRLQPTEAPMSVAVVQSASPLKED